MYIHADSFRGVGLAEPLVRCKTRKGTRVLQTLHITLINRLCDGQRESLEGLEKAR